LDLEAMYLILDIIIIIIIVMMIRKDAGIEHMNAVTVWGEYLGLVYVMHGTKMCQMIGGGRGSAIRGTDLVHLVLPSLRLGVGRSIVTTGTGTVESSFLLFSFRPFVPCPALPCPALPRHGSSKLSITSAR
jgi:hypothetical protein